MSGKIISRQVQGVILGISAAALWGLYNVGAKQGHSLGFTPSDMTFLRYLGSASLCLWLLARHRGGMPSLWQALVLTLAVGPTFGFAVNTGFSYAPLSHGVLIGPAVSMAVPTFLMWGLHGQRPSNEQFLGMALVLAGLIVIAWTTQGGTVDRPVWIGDLAFVIAGTLWGVYSYLMGRWQLPALGVTGMVGLLATIGFTPIWLIGADPMAHSGIEWGWQFLYHGVIGGALAFLVFGLAVNYLGAAKASLFITLTPVFALLMSIPVFGEWPGIDQWIGVGLTSLGMVVAMDIRRILRGG